MSYRKRTKKQYSVSEKLKKFSITKKVRIGFISKKSDVFPTIVLSKKEFYALTKDELKRAQKRAERLLRDAEAEIRTTL